MKKIKSLIIATMFLVSLVVVITPMSAERTRESPSNPVSAGLPQGVPTQFMPYFQDFESGPGLWFTTGLWHLVGPGDTYQDYYSPTHSFWYGQDATGDYDTWIYDPWEEEWIPIANDGILISPPIYLSESAVLTFWTSWEIEAADPSGFDLMQVWVNDGTGDTLVLQLNPTWDPEDEFGYYSSAGYNTPRVWVHHTVDLSAYAGKTVLVKFYFDTDDEILNNYRGWYVDDVSIQRAPVRVNPIAAFMPVKNYHLRQVNTCLGCIEENLPEDVPEDVQTLLDEMQEHINNANTTGNSIYANNELLKALKCCEDIQEKLGITCPL
jgi:hypothetical protein